MDERVQGTGCANRAWASETMPMSKQLFAALAMAAKLRINEFRVQDCANTAGAFAILTQLNEQLFAASASALDARLRMIEFNVQSCANATWAFAKLMPLRKDTDERVQCAGMRHMAWAFRCGWN